MTAPLMPMATAVWLVDNTALTFEQIAEFCGLHVLQVRGIADGEVATGIIGSDPIAASQLTREEIDRCEQDGGAKIRMNPEFAAYLESKKKKNGRYTPVARRQSKPDVVAWLVQNYPEMTDAQIVKLIGTTKKTIDAIRDRSHWNWPNITPKDPVLAGFCSQNDLNRIVSVIEKERERRRELEGDDAVAPPQQAHQDGGIMALFADAKARLRQAHSPQQEEGEDGEDDEDFSDEPAAPPLNPNDIFKNNL